MKPKIALVVATHNELFQKPKFNMITGHNDFTANNINFDNLFPFLNFVSKTIKQPLSS